jgi:mannuronan synthase
MKVVQSTGPLPATAAWRSLSASFLFIALSWAFIWLSPEGFFDNVHGGIVTIGVIGVIRNSWMLLNHLRAQIYQRITFPKLRAQERALAQPYPQRIFVVVASYREDKVVTERAISALAREISLLPSEVHLLFSVGSPEEMEHILALMRKFGRRDHIKIRFMQQAHGKRLALGQALRLVSREFHRVRTWHPDAHNDVVVMMDGDTEVQVGIFRKSLGFFRLLPDLGALTTNEAGHMITPEAANGAINPWFDLKFAKRHIMMCSHALSGRVLTLTGRLSMFRAQPVLQPNFINRVESDYVNHWVFGRFRFLMGDDKSTWFDLLASGWRMQYLPDVCINCLETRGGHFIALSSSLMFRWYGNLARNNWRAMKLGPWRMPFFIWLVIVDQRVSMWTSLVGPLGALFVATAVGPSVLAVYFSWVLLTRTITLWLLVPQGFVIKPIHMGLQLYDQWVGSAIKVAALMLMSRQSWSKVKVKALPQSRVPSRWLSLRNLLVWHRFATYILYFIVGVAVASGLLELPVQLHLP